MFAAGACVGVLFTIKVSAVALAASLMGYAFLRQVSRRRWPTAAVTVGIGIRGGVGTGNGDVGVDVGRSTISFQPHPHCAEELTQANMREIYRQTSSDDIMAKYGRYVSHFVGKRAQFGNLFLVFFAGWGLACVFAQKYRLFLLMYGGPQLLYLWYLVTFYPSTQPRYAIQFLPFLALGTMLLSEPLAVEPVRLGDRNRGGPGGTESGVGHEGPLESSIAPRRSSSRAIHL